MTFVEKKRSLWNHCVATVNAISIASISIGKGITQPAFTASVPCNPHHKWTAHWEHYGVADEIVVEKMTVEAMVEEEREEEEGEEEEGEKEEG